MTREEAIKKLQELQESEDTEWAHGEADEILCDLLNTLGFEDVVKEYYFIMRWYS